MHAQSPSPNIFSTRAHALGLPRIGAGRELKFAQEAFWRGQLDEAALQQVGRDLRARHWELQKDLDFVCVGDFAWYDQVLNTLALLGALPQRFGFSGTDLTLSQYFAAARGVSATAGTGGCGAHCGHGGKLQDAHSAMEMTKWFDTNYHYLVPEWRHDTQFGSGVNWLFEEVEQAQALGYQTKVCLLGPLSLLYLGKSKDSLLPEKLALLPRLVTAYQHVLSRLQAQQVSWVQIEEPILGLDLSADWLQAFLPTYTSLVQHAPDLLLSTYFAGVGAHADLLAQLPVAGVHLDLVRAPQQLDELLSAWPRGRVLSAGVIDGRNIWRSDLSSLLEQARKLQQRLQQDFAAPLWLATSCSLLHVPLDLRLEQGGEPGGAAADKGASLDPELRSWLAFAVQKLEELHALRSALNGHTAEVIGQFTASQVASHTRANSRRIHNPLVQQRLQAIQSSDYQRQQPFSARSQVQQQRWQLPLFPTTSIGSFPQTANIRQARAAHKRGELSALEYLQAMRAEIAQVIAVQEELGLDVLVHGEPERNDMVEYFGEQLWGYAFSSHGWVQSYGSRCVKPPIIYGDIFRAEAMTLEWALYAQSLSQKPVKGMLTGPVTMLQWSFVRDDQPRATTMLQLALALREEVLALEKAGIGIIQIDEPALREGLPLQKAAWDAWLQQAVDAFRLTCAGVADSTQIHTHMCYSEFNDILPALAQMDADVITIETSRSQMELLDGFAAFAYPNQIGPGVYDIHSPRVPQVEEMLNLLQRARQVLSDDKLWVNPDCGLKTRAWIETRAALQNMVEAARRLRAQVQAEQESEAA